MDEFGDERAGQPPAISTLEHLEGQQIGRYLIRQRLGGGGVATVYQADDQVMGRRVALKLLPPNPDGATLNRFRREALMAGALRHPHIVRIFQVGTPARGGAAYLAMELVEGESLASLLARQGMLQPAESCHLLEPIARALAFAHQHGIVHRDVKPGNILLRPVSHGTPYSVQLAALDHPVIPLLSDFGVARFLDAPELTSTGRTVGTPAFMAPEQCMGSREIDGRADIYALGTVLFRCVTGHLPFTGSMTQVLHAQVYEPVVIQDDVLRRLGPVAAILQRSLAKDPNDRYADAAQLAADLAAAAQRGGAGSLHTVESAGTTATLTLAAVDALNPAEAARPVTVLVGGATAGQIPMAHLPAARAGARPHPRRGRGVGIAAVLALVVLLGALGSWAWRRGAAPAPATPPAPQLAVLAAPSTAQGAGSLTATSQMATSQTAAPQEVIPAAATRAEPAAAAAISPTAASASGVGQAGTQPIATATVLPTFTPAPPPPGTGQPVVSDAPTPTALPDPTPSPEPTATAAPPPPVEAAPPVSETQGGDPQVDAVAGVCADVVDEFFMGALTGLDEAQRQAFRCPTAPAYATGGSLLAFAQGFMLALDESPFVYVYYQATGEWEQVVPSGDAAPETGGPPPFAQVWNENQRRAALGEMLGTAPTPIDGVVQVFSGGMLVGDRTSGAVYAFPLNRLRL